MSNHDAARDLFWSLAETWLAKDGVTKATMMGFPCLRRDGAFFASAEHKGDGLIVKLNKERVLESVLGSDGEPFAPAGKTFKEWLRVPYDKRATWPAFIEEAYTIAGG